MTDQPSLFPETTEGRAHRIDVMILDVLCGRAAYPVNDRQRALLDVLRMRRGRQRAISIGELGERLKLNPRAVKLEIADLTVRFRLPIGSSRDAAEGGYYLVMTHDEAIDSAAPHIHQGIAHFKRAAVLLDKHDLNVMLGQLLLQLPPEIAQQEGIA
jgi:hypothetical protein